MQELRLVAVSEDGSYAILAVPGRSGRFLLPIDDRLRAVAKGQFSRLAQYEIEVENPLRPKEIQDRIRAGETADQIADAAGIPPDRVRRFEGPVLAERQYRAQEAQRATIRGSSDGGPGPRLGDIVTERLASVGASSDSIEWDSRKRPDGNWQVQLQFAIGGRAGVAEWIYDPRRRHVIPDDDQAVRLCLPHDEWAATRVADRSSGAATVTRIGSRQLAQPAELARGQERRAAAVAARPRDGGLAPASAAAVTPKSAPDRTPVDTPQEARSSETADADVAAPAAKKAVGGRPRRASVPSWDEIMFGTSRQPD
jgi:hypothetical protein